MNALKRSIFGDPIQAFKGWDCCQHDINEGYILSKRLPTTFSD